MCRACAEACMRREASHNRVHFCFTQSGAGAKLLCPSSEGERARAAPRCAWVRAALLETVVVKISTTQSTRAQNDAALFCGLSQIFGRTHHAAPRRERAVLDGYQTEFGHTLSCKYLARMALPVLTLIGCFGRGRLASRRARALGAVA
eukprot:4292783-Pleurochrysis_carterae.AAC.1